MPDPHDRHTPHGALEALLEGNTRFSEGRSQRPHQSDEHRRALARGQQPFAVVLACSDSRVTVEFLLDQGFGDLFVVRTAGHVLDRSVQASIEFAVEQLGVSAAMVLGHESCGAVGAAQQYLADGRELPGAMPALVEGVRGHLDPDGSAADGVDHHVIGTIEDLLASSDLVRSAHEEGRLAVAGAVYGLVDGRIRLLTAHPERD
ncbi:carbonic anhydrase [Brachybacterium sp. GCM10030267]|uniref:carbonic anhydrase n=1 Tax=unclassified Brachybacterium TaxID=2623841 RepID=UPI003609E1A3